jgi:hypothetical protein
MAEKFGGDIAAILEDAWKRQEASGRAIWQGASSNSSMASKVNIRTVSVEDFSLLVRVITGTD